MLTPRSDYPVYWSIWRSLQRVRRRRRMVSAIVAALFAILLIYGLSIQVSALAMLGAIGAIGTTYLLQHGLLDGDLVAVCLGLLYDRRLSRIDLAVIDSQSHTRAASSDIDRAILRAVALYRSLNRGRIARAE
jgi:chromate transport protein ChrA